MCGFMVCFDTDIKGEVFVKQFAKIAYRGPDQERIERYDDGIYGFHRLAIMGVDSSGMQPFNLNGMHVVCNGELYNFRVQKKELIAKGYTFKSGSDCELLIPLYLEYGLDMFNHLDSEFAMVMSGNGHIIAARDPFGIRPMFYGYLKDSQKIIFASEAKCLTDICSQVFPFPPGYYYYDGSFVCYHDVRNASKFIDDDLDTICANIHEKLEKAVIKRMDSDTPVGYLLSGGLDSSLVCSIAARHSDKPIHTFAIGMENDAIDLKYAKKVSEFIGSIHHEVIITKEDVLEAIDHLIYILETWDITTIRASVGMYLLCKWIRENTDIKVLMTGEISDELFGYKYTDFAPNAIEFNKEAQKRVHELYMYDVLRADRCISSNSIEGRVPFGDLEFVDYVMGINPSKKVNSYNMGKYLLRRAFDETYLPKEILYRDKAAFSDAVGHSLVNDIKEYANTLLNETSLKDGCSKYKYHPPYTPESLYYRDIFTKYYAGFDNLIIDYWLPNQSWPGCQVDDPSARYLSNYGKSGE